MGRQHGLIGGGADAGHDALPRVDRHFGLLLIDLNIDRLVDLV